MPKLLLAVLVVVISASCVVTASAAPLSESKANEILSLARSASLACERDDDSCELDTWNLYDVLENVPETKHDDLAYQYGRAVYLSLIGSHSAAVAHLDKLYDAGRARALNGGPTFRLGQEWSSLDYQETLDDTLTDWAAYCAIAACEEDPSAWVSARKLQFTQPDVEKVRELLELYQNENPGFELATPPEYLLEQLNDPEKKQEFKEQLELKEKTLQEQIKYLQRQQELLQEQ